MIYEAQLIAFKEGLKIAIVWLVFYSYLVLKERRYLIKPFYLALLLVVILSAVSLFLPRGLIAREYLGSVISMSFAFFLIMSAAALFHVSGVHLFGGQDILKQFSVMNGNTTAANAIVFITTLLFFIPDSLGSVYFLRELSFMREDVLMTSASALSGLVIAAILLFAVVRLYKPYWIGNFYDIPQLLLFLAIVKLLGSGIQGVAELSLIPSVQRGFMKFTHDFVHHTFLILMVPDHPLLKMTVWNFIGFFFGSNFASFASLLILLFFPFLFVYHSLLKPVPEPEAQTAVSRRKLKSQLLSDRRKKALPVIVFIGLILVSWFSQGKEQISQMYIPKPRPIVVDRGFILIPVKDPTMNLRDGALHTFSLIYGGENIRILIIKKRDNTLTVTLDACEICPPEGYGLRGDHVVCIYCKSPIPIDTLGKPGGCNPIPLVAKVDELFVRIEVKEILKKWGFMKSGMSKEVIQ
jgi:uncharacterized membrane protein